MKVIFLKDSKAGKRHQEKEVLAGFALNFLFPNKLAVIANDKNRKMLNEKKANETEKMKVVEAELLSKIQDIENLKIEMKGKANEQGHLFAKIKKEEVADEVKKQSGLDLSQHIVMDEPIKEIGEQAIKVQIQDKETSFTLTVAAE